MAFLLKAHGILAFFLGIFVGITFVFVIQHFMSLTNRTKYSDAAWKLYERPVKGRHHDVIFNYVKLSNFTRSNCTTGSNFDWLAEFSQQPGLKVKYGENGNFPESKKCSFVKGRRIVANYGSHGRYRYEQQESCQNIVTDKGIDACIEFMPEFIDERFFKRNKHILRAARGAGYWLWKPYLIYSLLLAMDPEDVLLYLDADNTLNDNIEKHICLQNQLQQDIVVFSQHFLEDKWTKADAYHLMNVSPSKEITSTTQIVGRYMFFRKTLASLLFVAEWLTYAQDERIISDSSSKLVKETPGFKENRHDQTILSLLSKKWRIAVWPNPEYPWDPRQIKPTTIRKKTLTRPVFEPVNVTGLEHPTGSLFRHV